MPQSFFADENLENTNNPYLHLFAQGNPSSTTQKPENGKIPKAGDAYSNDTDRELAKAVRIAPDLSIPQGKAIAFYFDFNDGSQYKQGYTFKWLVSNNPKFTPKEGNDAFYSLSSTASKNIALGDNRVYCYVSKDGKIDTVIIRFKITESEKNTASEIVVKSVTLNASNAYTKNAETLRNALRVSPSLSVEQGKPIRFYFAKDSQYNHPDYSVVWTTPELKQIPIGREKRFELDTTGLAVGKELRRIFCDVTKKGEAMERVIITGLEILEKGAGEAQTTPPSNSTEPSGITPSKIISQSSDIKKDLRISAETVEQGEKIKLWFADGSPLNQSDQFFWRVAGINNDALPFGNQPLYEIDSHKLAVKDQYRIQFFVKKDGTKLDGNAYVNVTKKTGDTNTNNTIPTVSAAEFTAHQASIVKDKEIITAGDTVTFSFDAQYEGASYYWVFDGNGIAAQTGAKDTLVVNTIDLPAGRYRLLGTITSKNREQHPLQMSIDIVSNWIDIELESEYDISLYLDREYELTLPDGSKIMGKVKDQKIFRIDVPANIEQAEFRWVD